MMAQWRCACVGWVLLSGCGNGGETAGHTPITVVVGAPDTQPSLQDAATGQDVAAGPDAELAAPPPDAAVAVQPDADGSDLAADAPVAQDANLAQDATASGDASPEAGSVACTDASVCDDGNPCTVDACAAGACQNVAVVCAPDANPCTKAACQPSAGCVQLASAGTCSDKDPCTLQDACQSGGCVGKNALDCNDNDSCTDDFCVKGQGCGHGVVAKCKDGNPCTLDTCAAGLICGNVALPVLADCDDGNPCTAWDSCALDGTGKLACVAGQAANCNDGNACTSDSCAPATGCAFVPSGGGCDDSDPCTGPDLCAGDYCVGGVVKGCADDGNPCTVDYCVSMAPEGVASPGIADANGCVHAAQAGPCEDGNACTGADLCKAGVCAAGSGSGCDDNNLCTLDSCVGGKVCDHAPFNNGAGCTDGSACSVGDACDAKGQCVAKTKPDCSDADPCTADTCDPKLGCVHPALCDDSDPCTADTCQAGTCGHAPLWLFKDSFAAGNGLGWALDEEWQIGAATAGPAGNLPPGDPAVDHSPGGDNMVAGVSIGGIAKRQTHGMRYLTSPPVDITKMTYPALQFWRWLDADMDPYMVSTVEVFTGSVWKPIWKSPMGQVVADKAWVRVARDLSKYKHPKFQVRFGFSIFDGAAVLAVGSWNIDDVVIGGSWTCIDNPQP